LAIFYSRSFNSQFTLVRGRLPTRTLKSCGAPETHDWMNVLAPRNAGGADRSHSTELRTYVQPNQRTGLMGAKNPTRTPTPASRSVFDRVSLGTVTQLLLPPWLDGNLREEVLCGFHLALASPGSGTAAAKCDQNRDPRKDKGEHSRDLERQTAMPGGC
jgi:hypothetical protein